MATQQEDGWGGGGREVSGSFHSPEKTRVK